MRKIGAIVSGFATWYVVFLLLQFLAYESLGGFRPGLWVDAVFGAMTSLGSIAVALYVMRKVLSDLSRRQMAAYLGAAVASSFMALLFIKGLPADYWPLLSCLVGSLAAFVVPFVRSNA
jgi:hypothetical protein